MFLEAIVLSVIIGYIRGGKLRGSRRLNRITILLLILGIAIQYVLTYAGEFADISNMELIVKYNKIIQILSYILILIGILTNIKVKSMWAVLAGYILNFISTILNGWNMPNILENGAENVSLPVLGKTIQFFAPYPLPKVLSLGDVIISFGIFSLIQEIMLSDDGYRSGYRFL